jgi:hypothetical protein
VRGKQKVGYGRAVVASITGKLVADDAVKDPPEPKM